MASNYRLNPRTWLNECALSVALCYRDLEAIGRAAIERRGFGNTDFGIGLEYPAGRPGFVRWWVWRRHPRKAKIRTRRFYLPEGIYRGVVAGLMRGHGCLELAVSIEEMGPFEVAEVVFAPDFGNFLNYRIEPYSASDAQALRDAIAGNQTVNSEMSRKYQGILQAGRSPLPPQRDVDNYRFSVSPEWLPTAVTVILAQRNLEQVAGASLQLAAFSDTGSHNGLGATIRILKDSDSVELQNGFGQVPLRIAKPAYHAVLAALLHARGFSELSLKVRELAEFEPIIEASYEPSTSVY